MRASITAALILTVAVSSSMDGQTFTLDDYAKVARVSDVSLQPRGDRAVMVVAWPNYESNSWESEIVEVMLATRAQRTLTQRKSAYFPRWSPSGDRLAFLAAVDGKSQIFIMSVAGGDARQITHSPTSIGRFAWKPDGTALAFVASSAPETKGKFDDAFEINANDYLTLSAPRPNGLWVIGADGGDARAVARGDWSIPGLFATIAWSADGRSITFTKQDGAGTRDWEKRSLAIADVTTGALSTVRGTESRNCGAAWMSPDGTQLLLNCPVNGHVKNQTELLLIQPGGGEPRRLTATIDRNFTYGIWSPDSKTIVSGVADGTRSVIWEIPVTGPPRRRDVGRVSVADLDVGSDGSILFIGAEPNRPAELYMLKPGATDPERVTDLHARVAALTLGTVEAMSWKSDDGLPLDGVLTFPPNFDPARRYPLLLNIHGGPWSSSRETFSTRNQLLAAKGFLVFEPNYRGSDNHGNALFSAVYRDHGAGPGRDVMAGLALLKKRAYVDTTRIGVSGWSYGGYMTTWLIGHYGGWKAAMAGAAVIDLVDDYNLNDLSLFMRAYGETLTLPADLALMKEQSPMTYVDNMKTPLLLLSDAGDVRVPVTQSYKLFNALRERGREVRMKVWPVPGHFPGDPYRARDVDREWSEYFVQRLKDEGTKP
ncbi:MAG: S9 family peptidase [Gemmatimonadaceae bacterium]